MEQPSPSKEKAQEIARSLEPKAEGTKTLNWGTLTGLEADS